ncbi:MAG: uracil-DNA glycosylase [bacterium]|uniref:Type-5 uracil-DNA glycosylase n=1 Tax=Candidatus Methylomirabilis tolerans TaxID=3123416 RepID=A0AAJ1EK36_9BACT|nr:uracil-DNA glycosylase [Candidatus Methylomirabilis sp.]
MRQSSVSGSVAEQRVQRRLTREAPGLETLCRQVIACRRCPRLVRHRERTAREKVRRFQGCEYWGRPVPGFGDPAARLLVVGLAPAAHGGNRTGRIFTGDRSGDFLYQALYRAGFASQPTSTDRNDGLCLTDCYVTAAVRCAPPDNKPTPTELERCRPFLLEEFTLLHQVRVIVALGQIAFRACLGVLEAHGVPLPTPLPRFRHGQITVLQPDRVLVASYHPSQQNTQTGRLTEAMFQRIFDMARRCLDPHSNEPDAEPGRSRRDGK